MSKIKNNNYNPSEIEKKWQEKWGKEKIYSPDLDKAKRPFYNLMMFPYPSAEGMHVGNMYAFTGADVYGRFMRMQGFDVFEPIGLDGFGIHSENYAIKVGRHPEEQAKVSESNFYRQLRATGNGFDWSRKVETYDPNYYKWTQWLFIQLFKAGLAYRAKAKVNWCPSCKTVLADEQVIQKLKTQNSKLKNTTQKSKVEEIVPVCERCETAVEKKDLEQWFFRITKYAERLLTNLAKLNWSEKVKIAQKQWIGRSEGMIIDFDGIDVFTTRPETTDGATFLVLSPQHPFVASLLNSKFKIPASLRSGQNSKLMEIKDYVEKTKKKTGLPDEVLTKSGVFTGEYVVNPLTKKKIPIWIADYVLMEYGTGAIMAVPSEDKRDREFAGKYKIPIEKTSLSAKPKGQKIVNYHLRDWLISRQRYWGPPIPMIYCEVCAKNGSSSFTLTKKSSTKEDCLVNLKAESLNGWPDTLEGNISKQNKNVNGQFRKGMDSPGVEPGRFGVSSQPSRPAEPMPESVYKSNGEFVNDWNSAGWFAVPEEDLPVKLPFIEDYKPLGTGKAPLASHPEFYKTICPKCGGEAKRETDVSDTFLDSAWYFLRYVSTDIESRAFDIERVKKWLPVEMYIGGAEHSVLHLLYSRFITMVLHDLGYISFEEPFSRFYAHGLLIKEGVKMSKSKGNVVIPDEYIKKFGADTLRTYLMFMGPFSQSGDFRDMGVEGMFRFLNRVWRLLSEAKISADKKQRISADDQRESFQMIHKTIKKVTEDIEKLNYNTAIAALMEWYNYLKSKVKSLASLRSGQKSKVTIEEAEVFLKLLAPFAPHMTEELFYNDKKGSIHLQPWPKYDPKFLEVSELVIVIQVNGKLRGNIVVDRETANSKEQIENLAKNDSKVLKHLEKKHIKKVFYVEGKVINFVAV